MRILRKQINKKNKYIDLKAKGCERGKTGQAKISGFVPTRRCRRGERK